MKIKLLNENAKVPTRGSDYAAGYDLYANCSMPFFIKPHRTVMIGTGIALEIPDGYFGAIYARSGLASRQGLRPANCVGVVDSDYRAEIMVALHNDSEDEKVVSPGDRIAQLIIQKYEEIEFEVVDELNETKRNLGGFGSTGK